MKQVLCIALTSLMLVGCGMADMPKKMDDSNKKMDEMGHKMDQTNRQMEDMVQRMDHTNGGIDKQSKLIPFENMLKSENTENLSPIPTRLMPFGKELALVISADDMVELTYLWLKEIDEVFPAHKMDANGNEVPYTQDEIDKINHDKLARLVGLQIIAGFLPQNVVNDMITKQVYTGGRYEDTVYTILMLRVQFIRDVMLDASLMAAPLNNAGKIAQAVEYNKNIDFVAKLPFAAKISLKTKGFIPADISPVEKFDTGVSLKNWKHILLSAERDFVVSEDAVTGNAEEDHKIYQQKLDSYNQSKATIQSYIDSWSTPLQ
jgi:hypothetical protein